METQALGVSDVVAWLNAHKLPRFSGLNGIVNALSIAGSETASLLISMVRPWRVYAGIKAALLIRGAA
ncbi:MAG: hypothetical protein WCR20_13865 [Verrucomicrobiota bacterium]